MTPTRGTRILITGAVGLAGIGVGAAFAPVAATAATATTRAVHDRAGVLKNALSGLVKDGTLTQQQAEKVATTLDRELPGRGFGPGGHGDHAGPGRWGPGAVLTSAAKVLGMSVEDLRTALDGGQTLVEVAKGKGLDQAELVAKLVEAEKARLAEAVDAGKLSQEQADGISAALTERITAQVTRAWHEHGAGSHGIRGGRPGEPGPAAPPKTTTAPPTTAPSTTD